MTNTTELIEEVKDLYKFADHHKNRSELAEKAVTLIKAHYREALMEAVRATRPLTPNDMGVLGMEEAIKTINEIMK